MLEFAAFSTFVDTSFFKHFAGLKLDTLKLDTNQTDISSYCSVKSVVKGSPTVVNLTSASFSSVDDNLPQHSTVIVPGRVINVNTIEEFKQYDKKQLLQEATFGSNQLTILTFADLKKYKFYYWCLLPTVSLCQWEVLSIKELDIEPFTDYFYQTHEICYSFDTKCKPFGRFGNGDDLIFIDPARVENTPSVLLKNYLSSLVKDTLVTASDTVHVKIVRFGSVSFEIALKPCEPHDPKFSGWERTAQGKLAPKLADLGSLIDPVQLADQAVDLNLKLMKWRIAPEIDLNVIKNTKCLLLGAGTLGSYVARALLAWGVRSITFVDNGTVSFSNPVRQPLYEFSDCLDGGKPKAEQAASAMKRIFPLVNSEGISLSVPMAGHPITDEPKQHADYVQLVELIKTHDAIFLLMDSRESRWLPSVIGKSLNKIVINAALGFNSFMVMRHGNSHNNLGCYFCSDIVGPTDSLSDRTLDQMCTVTRPGVALSASSLAVELLVSILQHPEGSDCGSQAEQVLGRVPHQIRGFLETFQNVVVESPSYAHCSACSDSVVQAYCSGGWEFVKRSLNESKYIEDLCGLTELHLEAEKLAQDIELDDDW